MKRVAEATGLKMWILILASYFTFCVANYDNVNALLSVNNLFLCILIVLGYSLMYYIIFEALIGIFYAAQKSKIENYITLKQFSNIFRYLIIFVNIILYILTKIFVAINFYTVYFLLFFTICAYFIMFILGYFILKKHYIQINFALIYFEYAFIFLALFVILWGVL